MADRGARGRLCRAGELRCEGQLVVRGAATDRTHGRTGPPPSGACGLQVEDRGQAGSASSGADNRGASPSRRPACLTRHGLGQPPLLRRSRLRPSGRGARHQPRPDRADQRVLPRRRATRDVLRAPLPPSRARADAGIVEVRDASGTVVASQTSTAGHFVEIPLPAGSYTITGTFLDATDNGVHPTETLPLVIPAGDTVRRDFVLPIP